MTSDNQKSNVVVTRIFDATISDVWEAWSDSAYVMQWWGPTGFTCPLAEMDFREGGTSLVCMRAPKEYGGQDMYNTWTYTKIVPMSGIEYTFHFSDKDGNKRTSTQEGVFAGVPEDGHHVVTFKNVGDNRTEMTFTEHGYTSDQTHDLSKLGLEQCLDKMASIFAK